MVSRSLVCARYGKLENVGFGGSPSFNLFCPPRNYKDIPGLEAILLVGLYKEGCGRLHIKMPYMPISTSRAPKTS